MGDQAFMKKNVKETTESTHGSLKDRAIRLIIVGLMIVSPIAYSNAMVSLSRIELIETLAPLIPAEKQTSGNFIRQYTDIATITEAQRLLLNGYLAQSSVKSGTSATLFSPNMGATRAQAAVMIHRLISAANPKWKSAITADRAVLDANTVVWAKQPITDLVNAGVIEPVGPGYVFPKRAISLETASQWVAAARVLIPEPAPIAMTDIPTAPMSVRVVSEDVTIDKTRTSPIQAPQSKEPRWQVRVHTGLSLGQSPYQTNQSPAELDAEYYKADQTVANPSTGSGLPRKRRIYGSESSIELSKKIIGKPLWLVTSYGYGVVKTTMPATTIQMPVLYIQNYGIAEEHLALTHENPLEKFEYFQLTDSVRKTSHTIRLGIRHPFYENTIKTVHFEGYWGGGLAISTSAIRGSMVIELPKQDFGEAVDFGADHEARENYIVREKTRSFYHTHNQASVYGEVGGLIARNSWHVGAQAQLQLNPGELSVDESGNKRLAREISSLATIFVGRQF